jgi:hypothetical protein
MKRSFRRVTYRPRLPSPTHRLRRKSARRRLSGDVLIVEIANLNIVKGRKHLRLKVGQVSISNGSVDGVMCGDDCLRVKCIVILADYLASSIDGLADLVAIVAVAGTRAGPDRDNAGDGTKVVGITIDYIVTLVDALRPVDRAVAVNMQFFVIPFVILGNSFVPSYFSPLRNIPYMACSNFLATAMSACKRALFRVRRLSKRPLRGIATGCDQSRHIKRHS